MSSRHLGVAIAGLKAAHATLREPSGLQPLAANRTMTGMEPPQPIKTPKRRRRWRQFSVSTLLVVVTMASVGLAVVANRAQRQRRAVAAIRALGGSVAYAFKTNAGTSQDPRGPDWLFQILGWDYYADVVSVSASDLTGMTDATCSDLSALTSLEGLNLAGTQVTDAGLRYLAGLTSLDHLCLSNTQVTDAGLAHLVGLTSLQSLWLDGTRVTDKGCAKLQQALPRCRIYR
jgi:hypothetical protein